MGSERRFTGEDLAKHSSSGSCFLAVDGSVYDVTSFLASHPGGSGIVLANAGKVRQPQRGGARSCRRGDSIRGTQDVTELFHAFHKEGTIAKVASLKVGELEANSTTAAVHGSESVQERWKGSGKGNFVVQRCVQRRSVEYANVTGTRKVAACPQLLPARADRAA